VAAIRAWRPERGPFPAFASHCVRNQALLAVKAAARHKHQLLTRAISLNHAYGGDATSSGEPWALSLLDALPATGTETDPETRLLVNEQLRNVVRALPSLTERERRSLAGALDGRSYSELGPIIGGSTKAASHAADRPRRKLAGARHKAARPGSDLSQLCERVTATRDCSVSRLWGVLREPPVVCRLPGVLCRAHNSAVAAGHDREFDPTFPSVA
jgi:DNA-directed RNA polymerase specialized sigma24 family protein